MSKQEKLLYKNGARIVCVVGRKKYWRLAGDNKTLTQPVAVEHIKGTLTQRA